MRVLRWLVVASWRAWWAVRDWQRLCRWRAALKHRPLPDCAILMPAEWASKSDREIIDLVWEHWEGESRPARHR